jgi:hypothetical protein
MANRVDSRFEVTGITLHVAGPQQLSLDAHLYTAGTGRKRSTGDVLTVALGGLLVYCLDPDPARTFAQVWSEVATTAAGVLPERLDPDAELPGRGRNHVGVLLRVAGDQGPPEWNVLPAGASQDGRAHARVRIGRLTVFAHDCLGVRAWAQAWAEASAAARRLWPAPDGREADERRGRARIARTGQLSRSTATG